MKRRRIYLAEHESELARRLCLTMASLMNTEKGRVIYEEPVKFALSWTAEELRQLAVRFENRQRERGKTEAEAKVIELSEERRMIEGQA